MNARSTAMVTAALLALTTLATAQEHRGEGYAGGARRGAESHRGYIYDDRYNHGHYYPGSGAAFRALPPGARPFHYGGGDWYFHGGTWYRPYGDRFVVMSPPIGIGIGILPPYYTTVWFGGVPYYYADNTYYLWQPEMQRYIVTQPPPADAPAGTAAPEGAGLFAYPKHGQSETQQAADRYECHSWAVKQTGFDPTAPLGGVPAEQSDAKRADYLRAQRACLEGRGYSVN